jgi:hypothetical protein
MDFGEILTKAWKIIWKFKILWIFGILVSCGQGGGGGGGGGGGNAGFQFSGDETNIPPGLERFFYGMENFFDYIQGWQIAAFIVGFIFLILVLILVFAALSTIGRIGLIQGTVKAESGVDRMTFGELFNEGKPFFWRVLGFNFLAGLALFIIVLALLIPLIGLTAVTFGIFLICLIPIICLLVPASWLVTVVFEQVNIAIVLEDLDIITGLKRGWQVFRENIGNMIVMGLILGIGGFIIGFLMALPMILLVVPVVIGIIEGTTFGIGSGFAVAGICFMAYLPVLIVLNGILQAYIKSAWTLTYIRLTGETESLSETNTSILEDGGEIEAEVED